MTRQRLGTVYCETYMPIFLERFVLPVLATSVITVILLNPFKWDWQQRVSILVFVFALAYFVGHTLTKKRPLVTPLVEIPTLQPQVNQQANDCSANANGNNNSQSINCNEKENK